MDGDLPWTLIAALILSAREVNFIFPLYAGEK